MSGGSSDDESSDESSDEEDQEDTPYHVDGIKYVKHYDAEEGWLILEPQEYKRMGVPDGDGGIDFDSDEERLEHQEKINE